MKQKKYTALALCLSLLLCLLAGCGEKKETELPEGSVDGPSAQSNTITLKGSTAESGSESVSVSGSTVTISHAGEYTVTGTLDNGQLVIDTGEDTEDITVILDNVHISNATGACIYVAQAKKLKLVLAEGSDNSVTSGTESDMAAVAEDAVGAAIDGEDDIDLEGTGKLQVYGYLNNGVATKDDLAVQGGEITVIAANNGLRGSESVEIEAGTLNVTAQNDGIKATSADKEGKGYVAMTGGSVTVNAAGDGISAETELRIEGGELTVTTTGDPEIVSSRALKGRGGVVISGGTLTLNSTDHAIRSSAAITISGGDFIVYSSMGKGLAANGPVEISGECVFELDAIDDGINSDDSVTINGGTLRISAGEDGIHAGETGTGVGSITINGGTLHISAYQDGLDGKLKTVVKGGSVLALEASSEAKPVSEESQPFFFSDLSGSSRTPVSVSGADGGELDSMESVYGFSRVFYSAPTLQSGSGCTVTAGSASAQGIA